MQTKECVYFLSVEQAEEMAAKHWDDENWDLWTDSTAIVTGFLKYHDEVMKKGA